MARADSKGIAILKGLATPLSVGGKELERLDGAIRMLHVAMRNISFVAVLSNRRGGSRTRIRENHDECGEKQRDSEHQGKNAVW